MTMNSLSLEEDINISISENVVYKTTVQNVTTFYQLAKLYNLTTLAKISLSHIERCFAMVVESPNFLELEFNIVATILASSELSLHSEFEVINAANSWLKDNSKERNKYAKQLLLLVRLPLLSDRAFENILDNPSSFTENNECVDLLEDILINKENFFKNKSSKYYTSRYCNQNIFNILICGGSDDENETVSSFKQIDGNTLENVKVLPSMLEYRWFPEATCSKGEVYVFGGDNSNKDVVCFRGSLVMSLEKYSPSTNTWSKVADMFDNRAYYCVCAYMDKIFVIGGFSASVLDTTNSCLQFNTEDKSWKEVAEMNEARYNAACSVFEERIVVSGGQDINGFELNTVESYDVIANKWSSMPSMIHSQSSHSLVVVKSKLFVIGSVVDNCEVFDDKIKIFVSIKSPPALNDDFNPAISMGNKIVVFSHNTPTICCYDVDRNEWSEVPCEGAEHQSVFYCVKLPKY